MAGKAGRRARLRKVALALANLTLVADGKEEVGGLEGLEEDERKECLATAGHLISLVDGLMDRNTES